MSIYEESDEREVKGRREKGRIKVFGEKEGKKGRMVRSICVSNEEVLYINDLFSIYLMYFFLILEFV